MSGPYGVELMNALFGGMSAELSEGRRGAEVRLELDLRSGLAVRVTPSTLREIAECLNANPLMIRDGNYDECALVCDEAIIIATTTQLVIIASAALNLHDAVARILQVIAGCGHKIEWASFLRKNTSCPWDRRDVAIAKEYTALKLAFPQGNPFVFGPVDSDHYFYYVHDDIRRGEGVREADVQLNIKLYNVQNSDMFGVNPKCPMKLTFQGKDEYEVTRGVFEENTNTISFESNFDIRGALSRTQTLISESRPERFTVLLLLDPQCDDVQRIKSGEVLGLQPGCQDYTLVNRTSNTFEHGYVVIKTSFARA